MWAAAPKDALPQATRPDIAAAIGGHAGISATTFDRAAGQLIDLGYEPLPIRPGTKRPAVSNWTRLAIDGAQAELWTRVHPGFGIGLRTGRLVAIDIDILDPERAHVLQTLAFERFGATLLRVGRWPKRLLIYRTADAFPKLKHPGIEILGSGQQFVAFGIHPDTGLPYDWPLGDTPLDTAFEDLPQIDRSGAEAWLAEATALCGTTEAVGGRRVASGSAMPGVGPVRDAAGLVMDHRDSWLSAIAYHAIWDSQDAGEPVDPAALASRAWDRFTATADLARPRQDGREVYGPADAGRKVAEKLALLRAGRLPPRTPPQVTPVPVPSALPVAAAREALSRLLAESCDRIAAWHSGDHHAPPPRIGIRATVGLGKTAQSRDHLLCLRDRLRAAGKPHRILVFTPSHALAEESAEAWRGGDATVAVHRGYEARHPVLGRPMCRDLDLVRMALAAGQPVFPNSCLRPGGSRCHAFDGCLKQENLREIETADVVVAPYDALFTGLPIPAASVGVLVIDEGCWARAYRQSQGLHVETLHAISSALEPRLEDAVAEEEAWKDLYTVRRMTAAALAANGTGAVNRTCLEAAEVTADDCASAAALERRLRPDPGLRPGLPQAARRRSLDLSTEANRSIQRERLFRALERLLQSDAVANGRVRILAPDRTGLRPVEVTELMQLHPDFASVPVLHLDATLRGDLAEAILPGLEVEEIAAAMPHMSVTLITGCFGKGTLCPAPRVSQAETRRRAGRLEECRDHVRWEARRVAPGRVLVVTYQAIESAFADIPNVEVAHFNAIAGLDSYKDVALLIVIGRPLPSDMALRPLAAAFFCQDTTGTYAWVHRAVLMRDGSRRIVRVMQHEDREAEILRAAICDDEVIQAIGRGRGANRTAETRLEVQVLADVALPLVHDRVLDWDRIAPAVVQQMLLAGIAVDSPSDAALLHPLLFGGPDQAKKAFQRGAFRGHFPIENTYREMSLKSARYRRGGKGRSWQRAVWIAGDDLDARRVLEKAVGPLDAWDPSP